MKYFTVGDIFFGKSHTDLVNNTLGTHYKHLLRSSVELQDFGAPGVIAWFVFMDGTVHGYPDEWIWKNKINQKYSVVIREECISSGKEQLYERRDKVGYYPYRLAFQLDPFESGNRYVCRYVGAYRLKNILTPNMATVEYEKVMDNVCINDMFGGYCEAVLKKEDFVKDKSVYDTKVEQMGFSPNTLNILKQFNINTLKDVLELNGVTKSLSSEFREKIYNTLKK